MPGLLDTWRALRHWGEPSLPPVRGVVLEFTSNLPCPLQSQKKVFMLWFYCCGAQVLRATAPDPLGHSRSLGSFPTPLDKRAWAFTHPAPALWVWVLSGENSYWTFGCSLSQCRVRTKGGQGIIFLGKGRWGSVDCEEATFKQESETGPASEGPRHSWLEH